jgi:hypothetical protein
MLAEYAIILSKEVGISQPICSVVDAARCYSNNQDEDRLSVYRRCVLVAAMMTNLSMK